MAKVNPFRGTLLDPARVGDVGPALCPPYDVISRQEQYRLYLRSPYNFVRVELGQDQPDDGPSSNRYTRAASQLEEWLQTGALREDLAPALYVHDQFWEGGSRRSFFAAVQLAEWERREIVPHEQTLAGPKADRLLLLRHTAANLSPVFGLYEDPSGTVARVLAEAASRPPDLEAVQGGAERHRLWRLTDRGAISTIQEALAARPVYIADGHHRYETALAYRDERRQAQGASTGDEPWNYVLMSLSDVADPGLVVLPTHRLVKIEDLDRHALLARIAERFHMVEHPLPEGAARVRAVDEVLEQMASAAGTAIGAGGASLASIRKPARHLLGLVLPGEARFLQLELAADPREALADLGRSPAWCELDVAILHYLVLDRMLGIPEAEWKTGRRITYTRESREVLLGLESGEFQAGFFLNATPVRQILAVADAGDVMPQKSTFFHPKLPTGLVMHRLGDVPSLAVPAGSES